MYFVRKYLRIPNRKKWIDFLKKEEKKRSKKKKYQTIIIYGDEDHNIIEIYVTFSWCLMRSKDEENCLKKVWRQEIWIFNLGGRGFWYHKGCFSINQLA